MPSQTVSSVAQLRAALLDVTIDTIIVTAGNYTVSDGEYLSYGSYDGFHVARNVTIKSSSTTTRANFLAGVGFSKGIFHVIQGTSVTFDGIGFYNTKDYTSSANVAGIRHEGLNLTIQNSYFENNANGILGTPPNGTNGELHGDLNVQNSTFTNNGSSDGQEHQIYYTGRSVTVNGSSFTNSSSGHHIKTVVDLHTTVTNTSLNDGGSSSNSAINSTGGGDLIVNNNTITVSTDNGANNPNIIYYETQRDGGIAGIINISANTFVSLVPVAPGNRFTLLGNRSASTATINNNILSGGLNLINPVSGDAIGSGNTYGGSPFTLQTFRQLATTGTAGNDLKVFPDIGTSYFNYTPIAAYSALDGADIVIGGFRDQSEQAIFGGLGNDILSGGNGSDFLYGEGGDDTLFGGDSPGYATADYLFGGDGNDKIHYRPSHPRSVSAASWLDGGAGNDLLDARYADTVMMDGGSGDDILLGSPGEDGFNGGYGSDIVYGGNGQDHGSGYTWGGPADDTGTDIFVFAGAYGVDLQVTSSSNNYNYIDVTPLTPNGVAELGPFFERLFEFEYLQFSNGLYNTATNTFQAGVTQVSLATLLATPITEDPGESNVPWDRATAIISTSGTAAPSTTGADTIVQRVGGEALAGGDGNDKYVLDLYFGDPSAYPLITETTTGGVDTVVIAPGWNNGAYVLAPNVEIGVTYELIFDITKNVLTGNSGNNLLADFDRKNVNIVESNETARLNGGDGDDILYGGNANDDLIGGNGSDTAVYRGNRNDYTVSTVANITTVTDNVVAGSNDGVDTLSTIEFLRFADGTLNIATNVFTAGSNSSSSIAYAGGTYALSTATWTTGGGGGGGGSTITGTAAAETLNGTAGDDIITGLGGDDTLNGSGGNDTFRVGGTADGFDIIDGGLGSDTVTATSANTVIGLTSITGIEAISSGSFGGVSILGSGVANTLNLTSVTLTGITLIDGGGGNDAITGTALVDTIKGSGGDDTLSGGDGNDIFQVSGTGDGFDTVDGGLGSDTITALTANTVIGLSSITGVETITANALAGVSILGSALANTLNFGSTTLTGIAFIDGGAGNDAITGSGAADTIRGSGGDDTINAGLGDDIIQYTGNASGFDALDGGGGTDVVNALANNTVIGLSSMAGIETFNSNGFTGVTILGSAANNNFNFTGVTVNGITVDGGGGDDTITMVSWLGNLYGGDGNDTINAGANNGILDGGIGNDILNGQDGNDTLIGGAGTNTLDGGIGTDLAVYSATSASYAVSLNANGSYLVVGNGSTDTLSNIENVQFSNGTVAIGTLVTGVPYPTTGAAIQSTGYVTGTAGNDRVLTDNIGNTPLSTQAGADYVTLSNSYLSLDAGDGNDIIEIFGHNTVAIGGIGSDYFIFDRTKMDIPTYITQWGTINDYVDGTDKIVFQNNGSVVNFTALQPLMTQTGADVSINIAGSPTITIKNTSLAVLNASDFIFTTKSSTINGTSAAETLTGTNDFDTIIGGAGNDTLNGGWGSDTFLVGGTGDGFDIFDGGLGTDRIVATAANTNIGIVSITSIEKITANGFANVKIVGSTAANTLNFLNVSLDPFNTIDGGDGNDSITLAGTWDTIFGGNGADIILAGGGNDTLIGGAGNDTLNGEADTDTVDYSAGTVAQTINLSLTAAQLISTGNSDTILNVENVIGGTAVDTITGSAAANSLNGSGGNDRLKGNAGNDTIIGGTGTIDVAIFNGLQASHTIATNSGIVTVTDNAPTVDGNDGVDTISGIEKVEFKGGVQVNVTSPIVLDLDGNGVRLLHNRETDVAYDWNRDGRKDQTGWISKGDGFLVIDRDRNGTVSGGDELSFVDDKEAAKSDLDGLSAFDSNGDGLLSAADAKFSDFKVWQDKNGNGIADNGEVKSLSNVGIASINLVGEAVNRTWNWGDNMTVNTGSFTRSDGSKGRLSDVALSYDDAAQAKQLAPIKQSYAGSSVENWRNILDDERSGSDFFAAFQENMGGDQRTDQPLLVEVFPDDGAGLVGSDDAYRVMLMTQVISGFGARTGESEFGLRHEHSGGRIDFFA